MRKVVLTLGMFLLPAGAGAQDVMSSIMESNAASQYNYMSNHIANLSLKGVADRARSSPRTPRRQPAPARNRQAPAARSFTYASTPALRRQVIEQAVQRAARVNPDYGRSIAGEFAKHDYATIFAGLAQGTGLDPANAIDVMAGNMAVQWMIANNVQADPSPAAFRGLARQLSGAAAGAPAMADPALRARTAEELKLQTVITHAGWQSARREGTQAAYAQAIARNARRSGLDMTSLALTADGFVPRR